MSKAHIALQELQAVAIMLYRMTFWLSGKMVVLHLDNSTVSHFLSRLACKILSLTDKHSITHSSIYSYPSQCGSQFSVMGMAVSGVASSFSHCASSISNLGSTRGGSVSIPTYASMSALLHL